MLKSGGDIAKGYRHALCQFELSDLGSTYCSCRWSGVSYSAAAMLAFTRDCFFCETPTKT